MKSKLSSSPHYYRFIALFFLMSCTRPQNGGIAIIGGAIPKLSTTNSKVTLSSSSVIASNAVSIGISAVDDTGKPYISSKADWSFSLQGGTSSGTFGPSTSNGDGTYKALFTGIKVGSASQILSSLNGSILNSRPSIQVTNCGLALGASQVSVSASTVGVGSSILVTLTVKDCQGNTMSSGGSTVVFSKSGGTSNATWGSVVDHNNGTYTASLTGTTLGTAMTLSATINGATVTSSGPTVSVVAGVISLIQSVVSAALSTVGSGSNLTLTFSAKDASGNQHSSGGLTVVFSTSGGTSTGTIGSTTDNGNGTYTATFTGAVAGSATSIRATVDGILVTSASPSVTVTLGPLSLSKSTIQVSNSQVLFTNAVTLSLLAKDIGGNSFTSGGLTAVFNASGGTSVGTISSTTDQTNGTYTATFTGTKPGSALTIGAAIGGSQVTNSLPTLLVTGVNLEVPIELLDSGLGSQTSSTSYDTTRTNLSPIDYDGYPSPNFSFEIVAANADTSNRVVRLVDSSGTVKATISVPTATLATRYRVSFTPNTGADYYRVNLQGTTSLGQLSVYSARMLVQQTNATKTKLYFPLMADLYTATSTTVPTAIDTTSSISYTQGTAADYQMWKKNTSNFATLNSVSPWTFDAVIWTNTGTCYASLYNTSGSQVTVSEGTTTSTTPVLVSASFSDAATSFTNLNTFTPKIKATLFATCSIAKANLWVSLSNLTRGECYYRVEKQYNALNTSIVTANSRIVLDRTLFNSPTLTTYYETTGSITASSTLNVQAADHGTNDVGLIATIPVTGCSISSTTLTTSQSWIRSSACSGITNGDRYINQIVQTSGSVTTGSQIMVLSFGP